MQWDVSARAFLGRPMHCWHDWTLQELGRRCPGAGGAARKQTELLAWGTLIIEPLRPILGILLVP
jgi:hypothetical protein